jgi:hypothetical protein
VLVGDRLGRVRDVDVPTSTLLVPSRCVSLLYMFRFPFRDDAAVCHARLRARSLNLFLLYVVVLASNDEFSQRLPGLLVVGVLPWRQCYWRVSGYRKREIVLQRCGSSELWWRDHLTLDQAKALQRLHDRACGRRVHCGGRVCGGRFSPSLAFACSPSFSSGLRSNCKSPDLLPPPASELARQTNETRGEPSVAHYASSNRTHV